MMVDNASVVKGRVKSGRVLSSKMDKTITVLIERRVKHSLYGKYLTKSSKVKAHDESNVCSEGDLVTIKETRPLSKHKTWTLVGIESKSKKI